MRVLVTGASGLIGGALIPLLEAEGDEVVRLVRRRAVPVSEVRWDPVARNVDLPSLEGFDAVVHLGGASIARLWTDKRKKQIRESRTAGTAFLVQCLSKLWRPPRVMISASAIGYYGNRGDELLTENSTPGTGFLADVCRQWELATFPAEKSVLRIVRLRIGVVLSTYGGALPKIMFPFRFGLGGRLGSGNQYMSWISLTDLCRVIQYSIRNNDVHGPINAVAPTPVTNRQFSRALASALHRPALFPLPASAARMMMGEMADALLLCSARVSSARLRDYGFTFCDTEISSGLKRILSE